MAPNQKRGRPSSKKIVRPACLNIPAEEQLEAVLSLHAAKMSYNNIAAIVGFSAPVVRGRIAAYGAVPTPCTLVEPPSTATSAMVSYTLEGGENKLVDPAQYLTSLGLANTPVSVPAAVEFELKDTFKHVVKEYTLYNQFQQEVNTAYWVERTKGMKAGRPEEITIQDLALSTLYCHKGRVFTDQYVLWVRFTFVLHTSTLQRQYVVESMHFVPADEIEGRKAPSSAGYEFQSVVDRTTFLSSMKPQCYSLPLLKFAITSGAGHKDRNGTPWSLNGSVVVLGMGGNIIGIQIANALFGGTSTHPLPKLSLHVTEIEPVVVGACIGHNLLGRGDETACKTFIYSGDDSLGNLSGLLDLVDSNALKATGGTSTTPPPIQLLLIDCFDPVLGKTNVGGDSCGELFKASLSRCVDQGGILVLNTHFSLPTSNAPTVQALANHIGRIMQMLPKVDMDKYSWSALQMDRLLQAAVVVQLKQDGSSSRNASYFKDPSEGISLLPEVSNLIGGCPWSLQDHCSYKVDVRVLDQKVSIYSHFRSANEVGQ